MAPVTLKQDVQFALNGAQRIREGLRESKAARACDLVARVSVRRRLLPGSLRSSAHLRAAIEVRPDQSCGLRGSVPALNPCAQKLHLQNGPGIAVHLRALLESNLHTRPSDIFRGRSRPLHTPGSRVVITSRYARE